MNEKIDSGGPTSLSTSAMYFCSGNPVYIVDGNVASMAAGTIVWQIASAKPDLIVALVMTGLFVRSIQISLSQAWNAYRISTAVAI